jgi:hypothetical protein
MTRTAREMIRLVAIAAGAFCALAALTWLAHFLLPYEIAKLVLAPFYISTIVIVVGFWGVGPLGRRLNQAAIDDEKEERAAIEPKQPWQ